MLSAMLNVSSDLCLIYWHLLFPHELLASSNRMSEVNTTHAHARPWGYVVRAGVHLYVYVYVYVTPTQSLNDTLVVDSLFQALAVDFLSNF